MTTITVLSNLVQKTLLNVIRTVRNVVSLTQQNVAKVILLNAKIKTKHVVRKMVNVRKILHVLRIQLRVKKIQLNVS